MIPPSVCARLYTIRSGCSVGSGGCGELLGEDAAFPVAVRVETTHHALSRFRPGGTGDPVDYDPSRIPLEVRVEREPRVEPTLRARLDAWTRLQALLVAAGQGDLAPALAAAHPLPSARVASDSADARLRLFAGNGVGDGLAIAKTLATDRGVVSGDVVDAFVRWVQAGTPTEAGDCWETDRLEYRFAVGAATSEGELTLAATGYTGGRLDWHDLDIDADPANALGAIAVVAPTTVTHLLPTRLTFPVCQLSASGSSRTLQSIWAPLVLGR